MMQVPGSGPSEARSTPGLENFTGAESQENVEKGKGEAVVDKFDSMVQNDSLPKEAKVSRHLSDASQKTRRERPGSKEARVRKNPGNPASKISNDLVKGLKPQTAGAYKSLQDNLKKLEQSSTKQELKENFENVASMAKKCVEGDSTKTSSINTYIKTCREAIERDEIYTEEFTDTLDTLSFLAAPPKGEAHKLFEEAHRKLEQGFEKTMHNLEANLEESVKYAKLAADESSWEHIDNLHNAMKETIVTMKDTQKRSNDPTAFPNARNDFKEGLDVIKDYAKQPVVPPINLEKVKQAKIEEAPQAPRGEKVWRHSVPPPVSKEATAAKAESASLARARSKSAPPLTLTSEQKAAINHISKEILSTEKTYLAGLSKMQENIGLLIANAPPHSEYLSKNLNAMKENYTKLAEQSKKVFDELEQLNKLPEESRVLRLLVMYSEFSNYIKATEECILLQQKGNEIITKFQAYAKENPKTPFAKFLLQYEKTNGNTFFSDFGSGNILPTQRLPRHLLLIRDTNKYSNQYLSNIETVLDEEVKKINTKVPKT